MMTSWGLPSILKTTVIGCLTLFSTHHDSKRRLFISSTLVAPLLFFCSESSSEFSRYASNSLSVAFAWLGCESMSCSRRF